MLREMIKRNVNVAMPRDVHHRHHHDHRHLQFAHEQRQIEIPLQGRRVNDVHIEIDLV